MLTVIIYVLRITSISSDFYCRFSCRCPRVTGHMDQAVSSDFYCRFSCRCPRVTGHMDQSHQYPVTSIAGSHAGAPGLRVTWTKLLGQDQARVHDGFHGRSGNRRHVRRVSVFQVYCIVYSITHWTEFSTIVFKA